MSNNIVWNSQSYGGANYVSYPNVNTTVAYTSCPWCGLSYASNTYHTCSQAQQDRTQISVSSLRIKDLEREVKALREELDALAPLVQQIREELGHNKQDEEVCRYSEDGCKSPDSKGVPRVSVETVPSPRGNWRWPPKS